MGIKSLRKKSNNRPSSSNPTNPHNNSMVTSQMVPSATSFLSNPRMIPLLFSAVLFICVLALLSISSNKRSAVGSNSIIDRIYSVEIVKEFPHDPNAFTQGLLYAGNDTLFESTGINGRSSVRRVDIGTGKVLAIHKMQDSYFGEGLTLFGDRLFQVTWLKKTGFIYDRHNLSKVVVHLNTGNSSYLCARLNTFRHQMKDGWGLATDGKVLFGSDGTSTLYQINPQTFKVVKKHIIKYKGHEVHNLNELEYVNGEIWANVWQTDCIARISGKDGVLLGWIYLPKLREGLYAAGHMGIDVLNGIAWDQEQDRLFVTGKLWPKLYEIKVQPRMKPLRGDIQSLCMLPPVVFEKP